MESRLSQLIVESQLIEIPEYFNFKYNGIKPNYMQ